MFALRGLRVCRVPAMIARRVAHPRIAIRAINRPLATRVPVVADENSKPVKTSVPLETSAPNCKIKTSQVVREDLGLARYLRRILGASSAGICGGLATAQALAQIPQLLDHPVYFLGGGFALSIAGIMGIGAWDCNRQQTTEVDPRTGLQYVMYATTNPAKRLMSFGAISAGMGAIMAPLTVIVNHVDPILFPMATFLSMATMGGCFAYAMHQPNASLIQYRGPLVGALTGFVGLGLASLLSTAVLGPNMFASAWTNIDMYGGIVLFCGLTAYDVHYAVQRYQQQDADHLGHAASIYLDFCNFFVRFLSILLKSRLDRRD